MLKDQGRTMKDILDAEDGMTLRECRGGKFYFPFYLDSKTYDVQIDSLKLGVRAYNSLKRAGFNTIGELAEAIENGKELSRIRSCGAKTIREIMESLFMYSYDSLTPQKQKEYLYKVAYLNVARSMMRINSVNNKG